MSEVNEVVNEVTVNEVVDDGVTVVTLEAGESTGVSGLAKAGIGVIGTGLLGLGGYLVAKKTGIGEKVAEKRDARQIKRLEKRGMTVTKPAEKVEEVTEQETKADKKKAEKK